MEIEYIIVQAGGMGTRLGGLTRNRPKALVPVKNQPILFHLFRKFPQKKFIIIGDYRSDVMERYLRIFAETEYLLIGTEEKGNAAGIRDALTFLPDGVPFMLVWSDILFSEEYQVPAGNRACYVGIFESIPCSWQFQDGHLEKKASMASGVAGCFVFDRKERLLSLPLGGSFTRWLSESGIPLTAMDMQGSREVGSLEALREVDSGENRCRPYNHMVFFGDRVEKTGLTEEGKKLIRREVRWYEKVSDYGFQGIPRIYGLSPLTMERIHGENIFKAKLGEGQKKQTICRLVEALETLHGYEKVNSDYFALQKDYYMKTLNRIRGIREVIPFTNRQYIIINGKRCKNIFFYEEDLERAVREVLFDTEFGLIHGDCTLTNAMIDQAGKIYFIDARGYFGDSEFFGDVYYDWAKLYYSIYGRFDRFNVKEFELEIAEELPHDENPTQGDIGVRFTIAASGWEHLTEYFLEQVPGCDIRKIRLIHAIIWMSLASHCWEDYDSMCLAFYNGVYLWNEWMEEYGIVAEERTEGLTRNKRTRM